MNFKRFLIDRLAALLLDRRLWERIKHLVARVNDESGATGAEKREWVLYDARLIGIDVANYVLNLAVELAVTYLRSVAGK